MERERAMSHLSNIIRLLFVTIIFFIFTVDGIAAQQTSKITGKIVDAITGLPVANVTVQANTKTNIVEDKKFENVVTQTNSKGIFLFPNLSSDYSYSISAIKKACISDKINERPPQGNKTIEIEKPLRLFLMPEGEGIFLWTNGNPCSTAVGIFHPIK